MKKRILFALCCALAALPLYAQRYADTLPFASVGVMTISAQEAGGGKTENTEKVSVSPYNYAQSTGGGRTQSVYPIGTASRAFCSASALMYSGSKYASEVDWFEQETATVSGIRRLPDKPGHPQNTPVGDVPWELVILFGAVYILRIYRRPPHPLQRRG